MDNKAQLIFDVADRSYFALLKKEIHGFALEMGFTKERTGKLDIIVAELVTNLVNHAGGGHLVVKKIIDPQEGTGIEFISIDNGPGIENLKRMMQDGVSTKNTLGQGLGAINRLSDFCEIYTQRNWGTVLLSRIFISQPVSDQKMPELTISSLVLPKPGEEVTGDGFYARNSKEKLSIFVGDGLGHGPEAAKAVNAAIDEFKRSIENDPVEIIRTLHESVRKTRGLVATVAIFNYKERCWRICGVGNIATRTSNFVSTKSYLSYNGIIGHNMPGTLKNHEVPYENGQTLFLCSDGINTRWDLFKFPGILKYDLSVITASIFKDHTRKNDDSSVVAV